MLLTSVIVACSALSLAQEAAPPRLDPNSEPLPVLFAAFDEGGWAPDDAIELARRAALRYRGFELGPFQQAKPLDAGASIVLSEDTDLLPLLSQAFQEQGWPGQAGTDHAIAMANRVKAMPPGWLEGMDDDPCVAYSIRLIYCTANGEFRSRPIFISKACWETIKACPTETPTCLGGQCVWYELQETCLDIGCAYATDSGSDTIDMPCEDPGLYTCDCFPNPCDGLKVECGPCNGGPTGCPCAD